MVALVLVSHSHALAEATKALVLSVTGAKIRVTVAAGVGDDHATLGTNAMEIMAGIEETMGPEGVLVLLDMGSAILSAETALDFLDEGVRSKVRLCAAPFVEGAVAAGAVAGLGSSLEEVAREAESALRPKTEHLRPAGAAAPTPAPTSQGPQQTVRVKVPNPHGLHARPAARFIREAAAHPAEISVRNVTKNRGPVSARSLSGLASLAVLKGDEIEISAAGSAAELALKALKTAVESGLGDDLATPAPTASIPQQGRAIPVSGGLALGPLFFAAEAAPEIPTAPADDTETELSRFRSALQAAATALAQEQKALQSAHSSDEADIFAAQALILEDPALLQAVEDSVRNQRKNAAHAWHQAYERVAGDYAKLDDEYLRQRAADVRDIGRRVLGLLGVKGGGLSEPTEPSLLVVEDLTPAQVTALSDQVEGVILLRGGRTSHAAILLRARGLPAIARVEVHPENRVAAFDGETGELWLDPQPAKLTELPARRDQQRATAAAQKRRSQAPATTTDGWTLGMMANLGHAQEAAAALAHGAEGVGLFRTEFLFLDRDTPPSEAEQFAALRPLAETMGSRPVIIRTLDAGGDKELPYLGLPKEANPFLGVRAIRLCLNRTELFVTQLRAILRAGAGANFRIMFPMIAEPRELQEARLLLETAHRELEQESIPHAWPVPIGIMIEVPSAVVLIDELLPNVDFVSLGTNDLTQYTLAADRGNAELAHLQDALHPAVLRLIRQVVHAAGKLEKHVGVCGEAASDPIAAQVLLGIGVNELSLSPARIPKIKDTLRVASESEWRVTAATALSLQDAAEVRAYLEEITRENGK